ncbi:hypothetical protein D3C72_1830390 [compost metagenome]
MVGAGEGGRIDLDQTGAVQANRALLLVRLAARHDDDDRVAQGRPDQGQTDAGVARRALDNDAAGLQRAGRPRLADDAERSAVLDRPADIHELGLAEDLAARQLRRALQAHQRRIADQAENIRRDDHGSSEPWRRGRPS